MEDDFENPCVAMVIRNAHIVLVDSKDYHWLNQFKWQIQTTGYVAGGVNGKKRLMHVLINETPLGLFTNHKNAIRCDNRSVNLESVTKRENSRCRLKTRGSSRYKGVCKRIYKGKTQWLCHINVGHGTEFLGVFYDEVEAAKVYDQVAIANFGEFTRTNFPQPCDRSRVDNYQRKPKLLLL